MDVSRWERHEDFAVHPVGSKPKRTLICPADVPEPYLIPGHAYLFKTVKGWREQQVWSEVIAYRVAALAGVEVPPCFIAVDGDSGEVGNLVEFFYGYPGEAEPARFVHAVDLMRRFRAANAAGRPHAVRTNLRVCRAFRVPEPVEWWGRVLTFDALIGNTDRHLENWGFLVRRRRGERTTLTLAPAFDNGTSLGYEQGEERLRDACEPVWLNPYVEEETTIADGNPPMTALAAISISAGDIWRRTPRPVP